MSSFLPFIGITDFMDPSQVRHMKNVFEDAGGKTLGRRLGVGVMTSPNIMNGFDSEWKDAFPKPASIASIFLDDTTLFNVLHYADYKNRDIFSNLTKAIKLGGDRLDALQLDMLLPDPDTIKRVRDKNPHLLIILQVSSKMMQNVGDTPKDVVRILKTYGHGIDGILLDKSLGQGIPLDANELLPFAREVRDHCPDLGLVIAGGLGPDTMGLVEPFLREFPKVSLDAQARLRPSRSALDPISWHMATNYLLAAIALLK